MDIRILGCHNTESQKTRNNCIVIDDMLVLDAGGLTSSLSLEEQKNLKAVCLTHAHYDHVKDIPSLGMNLFLGQNRIDICCTDAVYEALTKYLINDDLYPNWFKRTVFNFIPVEHYRAKPVQDYIITAIPVKHPVPAVGYQVQDRSGKTIFYSGDTGVGIGEAWRYVSPELLIIEVTAPNKYEDSIGNGTKHLTPRLLQSELTSFREIKGYLPQVLAVHMHFPLEDEIASEVGEVSQSLECSISLAYEGMRIRL